MGIVNNDFKIVSDSSINNAKIEKVNFATVPMRILAGDKEFVDDGSVDTIQMMDYIDSYDGKTTTSCPNVNDWVEAFEGAKYVFVITISSNLSGTYSSALMAKDMYEEEHPESKVHVFDSLATGPKMNMIAIRLQKDIEAGMSFDEIVKDVDMYASKIELFFILESLKNLAKNGRVTPVVAALAGVLGIRMLGRASSKGTIEPIDKARGQKKAVTIFVENMKAKNFNGKLLDIVHCDNEKTAQMIKEEVMKNYPDCVVTISECTALCSYYAQKGGIIAGFEIES